MTELIGLDALRGPVEKVWPESAGERRLSEHTLAEIRALPARFPQIRSAVLPALDLVIEERGYLDPESMREVAGALDVDPGYVEGVATFYSLTHTDPVGRHRLYVCTNLSCMLRGGYQILEAAMRTAGVEDFVSVSEDGLFSVEEVECLGACEFAPVMRLDHRYQYDLTPEKVEQLIAERRAAGAHPEVGTDAGASGDTPASGHPRRRATGASKPREAGANREQH